MLLLVPDVSMVGYFFNTRLGAVGYNLIHILTVGVMIYIVGYFLHSSITQLAGTILMGHSSMDRLFGYGLKYPDSFKNTHLGSL